MAAAPVVLTARTVRRTVPSANAIILRGNAEFVKCTDDPDFERLLLCTVQDDRIGGAINLSDICCRNFCNTTIGYWTGMRDQRKGFMTAGISLVLRLAFQEMGLHRIEANVQAKNEPSKGLLAKVGFRYEGLSPQFLKIGDEWKEHERWAICAEDVRGFAPGPH